MPLSRFLKFFRQEAAQQCDQSHLEAVGLVVGVGKTHTYTGLSEPIKRRAVTILDSSGVLITYLWGADCRIIGNHLAQIYSENRLALLHLRSVRLTMIDQGKLGTVPGTIYMTSPPYPGGRAFPPALQQLANQMRAWFHAGGSERRRKAKKAVRMVWADAMSKNPHRTPNFTAATVFDI